MKETKATSEIVRAHMLIAGRVQGVCYRATAQDRAQELGLTGWVRNLPDGRVELVAEGPKALVEALEKWCWDGPPFAQVTDVNVVWETAQGGSRGFELRR